MARATVTSPLLFPTFASLALVHALTAVPPPPGGVPTTETDLEHGMLAL